MPSFARFIPRWVRRRIGRSRERRSPVPDYDAAMSMKPPPSYEVATRGMPPRYSRVDEAAVNTNSFYRNEELHVAQMLKILRLRAVRTGGPFPAAEHDPSVKRGRKEPADVISGLPPRYRYERMVGEDLEQELDTLYKLMDDHLDREFRDRFPTQQIIDRLSGHSTVRELEELREWRLSRQADALNLYAERLNDLFPRMISLFEEEIKEPAMQQHLKQRYDSAFRLHARYKGLQHWLIAD